MDTALCLPPVPSPPHDPRWWRLDGRVGWRVASADGVAVTAAGTLTLATAASAGRSLAEPSGSLGGLVLPRGFAQTPDGSVYLLHGHAVLRSDACARRFDRVPHVGGEGDGPRQFRRPTGLAARRRQLAVADRDLGRVSVFSLPEMALMGVRCPPAEALPWQPTDVAFGPGGRLYVADPLGGHVHRFSARGVWEAAWGGLGAVEHVALDREGTVYAFATGDEGVRQLDGETGADRGRATAPHEIAAGFDPLAVAVGAAGRLGIACEGGLAWFGRDGRPSDPPADTGSAVTEGTFVSEPLDSYRHRCVWHRVVLEGKIPPGTSVFVETTTADVPLPIEAVQALPDHAWGTGLLARESGWEGLVRSEPGRYLWLRLRLRGRGAEAPRLGAVRVEFPRISLRRYLPAVFGEEPASADFTDRLLAVFDTAFRGVEEQVDRQAAWLDPRTAPASGSRDDALAWLAGWLGLDPEPALPEGARRARVGAASRQLRRRGTPASLRQRLLSFLGIEDDGPPLLLEHFRLRRWLHLGAGRLGDESVLWGETVAGRSRLDTTAQADRSRLLTHGDPLADPFAVHAHRFSVFVPAAIARDEPRRRALARLVDDERPAHARACIAYVEPRFRVGVQSSIGLDAVVGRYPDAQPLDQAVLGQATVLGGERRPERLGAARLDTALL